MATTSQPRCLASTDDTFNGAVSNRKQRTDHVTLNNFREAQFSNDGTTVITQSEDQCLRTFILPEDLLETSSDAKQLSAYNVVKSPTNIQAYAVYPNFSLSDVATTVALYSARDLPVRLVKLLYQDHVQATYPLIYPQTEAYIAPSSIAWTRDGAHFITGSMNLLSCFDSSVSGAGPIIQHRTVPSRSEKRQEVTPRTRTCVGQISALSINCDGVLAAGTLRGEVALYSNEGAGECTTAFSVDSANSDEKQISGDGVTQLAWSPCGTYLSVAERHSDVLQVFDTRNTHRRVSYLSGRKALTSQKLGVDVVPSRHGHELWAGGTDGCVRMWENPGRTSGEHLPDRVMESHQGQSCHYLLSGARQY